jgi:hypothetical protein
MDESQLPNLKVTVAVTDHETDAVIDRQTIRVDRIHRQYELAPPPKPGIFTLDVTAESAAPLSDVFAVVGEGPSS